MESKINDKAEELVPEAKEIKWYQKLSLPGALAIVIAVAFTIVATAYFIYWTDEDRKYDIARGGYKSDNKALNIDDSEVDRVGPVDSRVIKQKIDYLEKEVEALSGMGNFDPNDLSDENLQIIAPSQPSL